MTSQAYFLVDVVPTATPSAAPRRDIFFDGDYKGTNLTSFISGTYLKTLYVEKVDVAAPVPAWEGLVWNVLYGKTPATDSAVKPFPMTSGPVAFRFFIPTDGRLVKNFDKVSQAVGGQFPASQTLAISAPAPIYRGNSLKVVNGTDTFTLQYIVLFKPSDSGPAPPP